jgi:hypothetical protein
MMTMPKFIKNISIAQQKQIAKKQRDEQQLRQQSLKKTIEAKKKSVKSETEIFKEIQKELIFQNNQQKR